MRMILRQHYNHHVCITLYDTLNGTTNMTYFLYGQVPVVNVSHYRLPVNNNNFYIDTAARSR